MKLLKEFRNSIYFNSMFKLLGCITVATADDSQLFHGSPRSEDTDCNSMLQVVRESGEEDFSESVWAGFDPGFDHEVVPYTFKNDEEFLEMLEEQSRKSKIWLQIAGMFDSGTHLLGAILDKNLGRERFRSFCPDANQYHCHWWKHLDPDAIGYHLDSLTAHGVHMVLLALVRSPLSEMTSWMKAPYNLKTRDCLGDGKGFAFDDKRRCTLPKNRGASYQGLTGVWNHYTDGYELLALKYPKHDIKIIEYERLVIEPDVVYKEILELLQIKAAFQSKDFQTIAKDAKHSDSSHGRVRALAKIRSMDYLNLYDSCCCLSVPFSLLFCWLVAVVCLTATESTLFVGGYKQQQLQQQQQHRQQQQRQQQQHQQQQQQQQQ